MTLDIEQVIKDIKQYLELQERLRNLHEDLTPYYSLPYDKMWYINRLVSKQVSDKFMEPWVANHIGGFTTNSDDKEKKKEMKKIIGEFGERDFGDIYIGDRLMPGKNNIELKYSFNPNSGVGGGQLRLYEPVAWYLFFKGWNDTNYEMFLLSKQQLVDEIEQRSIGSGLKPFSSSQGTGKFDKMDNTQRIKLLKEEIVTNQRQDLIGWDFNPKTEEEYYKKFKEKYLVRPEEISKIVNETI
jgi:hypothetical protein